MRGRWIIVLLCLLAGAFARAQGGAQFADSLSSGGSGPAMVTVSPGRFRMGCVSGLFCDNNLPVHEVVIERPFAMSVYEITRGQFQRFVDLTGYRTAGARHRGIASGGCYGFLKEEIETNSGHVRALTWRDPGFRQTDDHPVVCVTWIDASEYVKWLAAETGKPYRLPSEAEWEYAARAGLEEDVDSSTLCRRIPREDITRCIGAMYTVPVDSLEPNAFGLYGMERNAFEWVEDCWRSNYDNSPRDGSAWVMDNCPLRVARGGGWGRIFVQHEHRGPLRTIRHASNRIGFRVAQSPTE